MSQLIQLLNDLMNVIQIGMAGILMIVIVTGLYLVNEVVRFDQETDNE